MISFENINKSNWKYALLYKYVNPVHNYIFYRRFYVLHSERIPKDEPIVAICNHQNGLSDALGILFAFKKDGRYPVFIARADIFKKEIAAKALRFLRIMPAFRAVDVGKEGLEGNDEIFNKSAQILAEDNGVVCLFPEAGHEDCHHLGTFKKGFARIAFSAAEAVNFEKPIQILPMSNHYSSYFGLRNKLIITIGEPFTFEDLYDIYKEHPQRAQKMLADRAREKVKPMMLDIEDLNLYEEYDAIRNAYSREYVKKQGLSTSYFPNIFEADKKIVAALDKFRSDDNEKFNKLMGQAKEYSRLLDKLHLRDWIFGQKFTFGMFLLRCLMAILVIPFVIYGFVMNFIPYNASTLITRKIKDQMLHSSFHFVMGVLFSFPLWYLILFITAWCVTGVWWIALLFLISLPISLLMYIHSKLIVKRQYNRLRRFGFWFRGNRFYLRAVELRKEIIKTVGKLME
jgi:1-acyl-sn-glycerol-3-phosphate acyltransferase